MTDQDGGWDDLLDPAPDPPAIVERIEWTEVYASLTERIVVSRASMDRLVDCIGLPVTDETSASDDTDGLTLFGDHDQFHVAWSHWKGMPEFHQDDLKPESELVVKFKTAEAREEFARLLGREIRREEPRGIWFPKIEIAHFWDKRYRDETATTAVTDAPPELTEADETSDEQMPVEEEAS